MTDCREVAKRLLELVKRETEANQPKPTLALFVWRERVYFGQIQAIYADVFPDTLLVSKTSSPVDDGLVEAIEQEEQGMMKLTVSDEIDFEGNYHVLRLFGGGLVIMTPEQTEHVIEFPFVLNDQNHHVIGGRLINYNKA